MEIRDITAIILASVALVNFVVGILKHKWPTVSDMIRTPKSIGRYVARNYLPIISIVFAVVALALVLWPASPSPAVRIMYPTIGDSVSRPTIVTGVSSNIRSDSTIWICIVPLNMPEQHFLHSKPARIGEMGEWRFKEVWIGRPEETGMKFDIVAMLTDRDATVYFQDYVRNSAISGIWYPIEKDELPLGTYEMDRIAVIRQ